MRWRWRGRDILTGVALRDLSWRYVVHPDDVVVVPQAYWLAGANWYSLVKRTPRDKFPVMIFHESWRPHELAHLRTALLAAGVTYTERESESGDLVWE